MSHCFFDITIGHVVAGRILLELLDKDCPKACENFRSLCTGDRGKDTVTKAKLHYKGLTFHRVIPNFIIQTGDVTRFNGTGGVSVFGGRFVDESFLHPHTRGVLSMANSGPHSNGSQFFICLGRALWLDGHHVVFGRVVYGMDIVDAIGGTDRKRGDLPAVPIVITECGVCTEEEAKAWMTSDGSSDAEAAAKADAEVAALLNQF